MSTDNFGSLGADFFIKTYNKGSAMSQADLDALVQYVQLTTTILAIGDFTPDEQDSVWMILERVDVPSAPGYTVTNNTDVTMTSGGMVTINSMPWSKITGKPSFFSGDYNDLTNKPNIPTVPTAISEFTNDSGYITLSDIPTSNLINSGNTAPGSAVVANETDVRVNFSDGGSGKFIFKANGQLQLASGGDIVDSNGTSVLGSGPTNEITNTEPSSPTIETPSTYSVSVGTDGVVTMVTARGVIEFGAQPEVGAPNHLHIMRPASQEGATDLFFGDDYNYVKLPAAYGTGTQGVEIGSSYGQGTVGVWRFGTDGVLTLPEGGVISEGGGISGAIKLTPAGGANEYQALLIYPTAGEGDHIHLTAGGGTTELYLGDDLHYVKLESDGNIRIQADNGVNGAAWTFGTDGNLTFPDATIQTTAYTGGGGTTLPADASGYLVNDGTGALSWAAGDGTFSGDYDDLTNKPTLFSGDYDDLTDKPTLFSGDYDDLNNKPTYRIAVATGSGPGGNLQADSLALAGLNPVTDIPSTWGGDLILQGGVGGANGDLYGEVRIKSGQIGANYEWHFTTDKKIKLPAGGDIVDSTGATAFVSLATLKQVVADSTDFADFKSRIAGM